CFAMTQTTLSQIFTFIRRNNPHMKDWTNRVLNYWIGWNIENNFLIPMSETGEHLDGVIVARPVIMPEDGNRDFSFEPLGDCIYVDLAIAKKPLILKGLVLALLQKYGNRK